MRACDEQGMCYIPATRVKQHADLKNKREERLKRRKLRAEWAAAGLDVDEMEKQELAKKKKLQQEKNNNTTANSDTTNNNKGKVVDETQVLEAMLGPVPQAPPPRPESERETRAEKEKGKLWVMSNIAPKKVQEPLKAPNLVDHKSFQMPTRTDRRAALESVREASHTEQREYAMYGHGGRIASGASEHGDISYQIVATSKDNAEEIRSLELVAPKPRRHRKTITPHGIIPPISEAMVSAMSASRIQIEPRPTHKPQSASLPSYTPMPENTKESSNGPTISQPTLIQPTAQRLRRSLDVVVMPQREEHYHHPVAMKKDPIDIRTESPRFFNRARASLDTAISIQTPVPTSPASPPFSSSSSDAGSIASRRSVVLGASISRSSTPPCVMNLADRACKSRWEANAKERKVWKGEVNRITLQKLNQNTKRHHESKQEKSSVGGNLRLQPTMSATSTSSNLALVADKRLRRASLEPSHVGKQGKVKRRSSQKS